LRYLEHGHLPLVYEALHERSLLLRNAPHLVAPLPFVLPFYQGQRVAPWQWRLGLTLYDLLASSGNIARSRPLSARHIQATCAGLSSRELLGGALYHDALMDDARLCLAVLQTAARHGAVLANHVEAIAFEKHAGTIVGVEACDQLTGNTFLIHSRAVLNATGPWGDAVCRLAGDGAGPYLQPTKGVHLIAPPRGHRTAYLLLHPRDGRVFFVIPWLGKTLIGTTDTVTDAGPDSLHVLPNEIDYLLEAYNRYFDPPLRRQEVLGTFAGLRPLVRADKSDPSAIPREFRLKRSPSGLMTALGGKYTTYRRMAETITDSLGRALGKPRRCCTRSLPLEGTPEQPWSRFFAETTERIQRHWSLADDAAAHLVHRYGNRIDAVIAAMTQVPRGFERVHPDEPDLLGEQRYQRDEEMAIHPGDFFLRRSRIGMYRPEVFGSDY
jgi:glycerol-3-phosphate dehydrogenase